MQRMKLSPRLKFVKPSQAISRDNCLKIIDVSGAISVPINNREDLVNRRSIT